MKKLFTAVALGGLLAGCASKQDVSTHYAAFSGKRTDLMSGNMLEPADREVVWLNASRVFDLSGKSDYYLEVSYMAKEDVGFLEIDPGETLSLLADGKKTKFFSSGSLNTRKTVKEDSVEFVKEHAIYHCTAEQLREIANAKKVTVGVAGNKGLVMRDFQPENFGRFQRFVEAYVDGNQ